jgi:hypothetical protein
MTHRLSMPQFEDNLARFYGFAVDQGWAGESAIGECGVATASFTDASRGTPMGQSPGGMYSDVWDSDRLPHTGTHTESAEFTGFSGYEARAHPRHKTSVIPPQHWEHAANIVNTESGLHVVDWTARQFDSQAAFPRVVSVDEFQKNWTRSGPQ